MTPLDIPEVSTPDSVDNHTDETIPVESQDTIHDLEESGYVLPP